MKKFFILTALLLPLLPANAATASAKSANSSVNTKTLTLIPTSRLDGILLTWNYSIPDTVVNVYRDGVRLKTVYHPATEFLDATAQYGVVYEYEVELTIAGLYRYTCSAKGTRNGTGTAPSLKWIRAARLWLEDEGPWNLAYELPEYDKERFELQDFVMKLDGKKYVATASDMDTGQFSFDVSSLWTGNDKVKISKHGAHEIEAYLTYTDKVNAAGTPQSYNSRSVKCTANVFFDKFGSGNANSEPWFTNWRDDGAVANLKGTRDGKAYTFSYWNSERKTKDGRYAGGECFDRITSSVWNCGVSDDDSLTINGRRYTFPRIVKKNVNPRVGLYPAVVSLPVGERYEEYVGEAYDGGIGTVALVCSHELFHRKMALAFEDRYGVYNGTQKPAELKPLDATTLSILENYVASGNAPDSVRTYLNVYRRAIAEVSDGYCDYDGDGVMDCLEDGLGTRTGDPRSNDGLDDAEYVAYANQNKNAANAKKDWSFPGSQIATEWQYLRKSDWLSKRKAVKESYCRNWDGAVKTAAIKAKNFGAKAFESTTDQICGKIYDEVIFATNNVLQDVSVLSVGTGVLSRDGNGISALSFPVVLTNSASVASEVSVTGYLCDEQGKQIAWTRQKFSMETDVVSVELVFSSDCLYPSHARSFRLSSVTVDTDACSREQFSDVVVCNVGTSSPVSYENLIAGQGYIRPRDGIEETRDGNLRIGIPLELLSNGVWSVAATLKDGNGAHVAAAEVSEITVTGMTTVAVVFLRSDIFLSKKDGAYTVGSIRLFKDGELVETLWDAYTTAAYSWRDFADGSETIFADAGSFRREADLVGADGLCDALNFSFAVTNLAPSEAEYVARIYLCGTNDELVCSSTKNVGLGNALNLVDVPFRGTDIKECGVEGPYYVSEVVIEDAESGGIVERFAPERILIDRMLSEFGESPVALNGEVTLAEGTGNGTFVVNIPVRMSRPATVRASAVLVAADGTPVVTASSSAGLAAGMDGALALSFDAAGINATGVRGPYRVRYLVLSTDYAGVDEIHVDDPGLGVLAPGFILYVDALREDDSGDGFTPGTAKSTIQGAVKVAQPFDTILVADGTYEPVRCGVSGVTIRSVNGSASTIIDGQGQTHCVELWASAMQYYDEEAGEWYYAPVPSVEGFTLRNGWTQGVGAGLLDGEARNCVITDCRARYGGGAAYATLENCVLYGNSAEYTGGGAYECALYRCTVSANEANGGAGGVAYSRTYNSIVYGNTGADEMTNEYDHGDEWGESVFEYSCTLPLPASGDGNIDADPLLVDPVHGDVRLRSASPCIDAANAGGRLPSADVYGHPRVQGNAPEMGAVEGGFEDRICVSASVRGIGTVSPVSVLIEPGGVATFTASSDVREFLAFEIDGVRVSTAPVFTLRGITDDVSITAVFKPGAYYVRPGGSDDASGVDWEHAKETIQGALDDCGEEETVYVASGVYAPFDSNNKPVAIRSMLGAEETIIDAGGSGCCAFMGSGNAETNTALIGFTLRNGAVGGAGGGARGGTLVDCRVINNRAGWYGGGVYGSVANRCVISNNAVIANSSGFDAETGYGYSYLGGGAYEAILHNCLVTGNAVDVRDVTEYFCRGGGAYSCTMYNCTVAGNAILAAASAGNESSGGTGSGNGGYYGAGSASGSAYNTIFWENLTGGIPDNTFEMYAVSCLEGDVNPGFAADGFMLSADSPCIDAGDDAYASGDMDVAGKRRIAGGCVDIGAYEFSQDSETAFYEIAFWPNGGMGAMERQVCAFGERQSLSGNQFVREGYTFTGWSLSEYGDVVYLDNQQVYNVATVAGSVVDLFAVWVRNAVEIAQGAVFAQPSLSWTATTAKALDGAVYDAEGKVAGVIQLKVAKPNAKKHNAKVSGSVTLLDGKKRTLKSATANVSPGNPITANLSMKGLGTLAVTISDDGFTGTLGGYTVATAKVGGKWTRKDARVYADATSALPAGTVVALLPDAVPVRVKGGKWAFDKAASITYKKGVLGGDTDPKKPNVSAMKLTYTPKTGLFKGSFKVYAVQGGKLKKYTVKIAGVVVDGEGTGAGRLAKPATTWNVSVSKST